MKGEKKRKARRKNGMAHVPGEGVEIRFRGRIFRGQTGEGLFNERRLRSDGRVDKTKGHGGLKGLGRTGNEAAVRKTKFKERRKGTWNWLDSHSEGVCVEKSFGLAAGSTTNKRKRVNIEIRCKKKPSS